MKVEAVLAFFPGLSRLALVYPRLELHCTGMKNLISCNGSGDREMKGTSCELVRGRGGNSKLTSEHFKNQRSGVLGRSSACMEPLAKNCKAGIFILGFDLSGRQLGRKGAFFLLIQ